MLPFTQKQGPTSEVAALLAEVCSVRAEAQAHGEEIRTVRSDVAGHHSVAERERGQTKGEVGLLVLSVQQQADAMFDELTDGASPTQTVAAAATTASSPPRIEADGTGRAGTAARDPRRRTCLSRHALFLCARCSEHCFSPLLPFR